MKYLTAEKLGITSEEREALLKVKRFIKGLKQSKNLLSRIKHRLNEVEIPARALFNMNRAVARYDCGTAGCIGGFVFMAMEKVPLKKRNLQLSHECGLRATAYVNRVVTRSLNTLFYPLHLSDYDLITPKQAANQIETFLRTGTTTW